MLGVTTRHQTNTLQNKLSQFKFRSMKNHIHTSLIYLQASATII
jgi:hypothetical protein